MALSSSSGPDTACSSAGRTGTISVVPGPKAPTTAPPVGETPVALRAPSVSPTPFFLSDLLRLTCFIDRVSLNKMTFPSFVSKKTGSALTRPIELLTRLPSPATAPLFKRTAGTPARPHSLTSDGRGQIEEALSDMTIDVGEQSCGASDHKVWLTAR